MTEEKRPLGHKATENSASDAKPPSTILRRRTQAKQTTLNIGGGGKKTITVVKKARRRKAAPPVEAVKAAADPVAAPVEQAGSAAEIDSKTPETATAASTTATVTEQPAQIQAETTSEQQPLAEMRQFEQIEFTRLEAQKKEKALLRERLEEERERKQQQEEEERERKKESSEKAKPRQGADRKQKPPRKHGRLSNRQALDTDELMPKGGGGRRNRSHLKQRTSEISDKGAFEKPTQFVAKDIEVPKVITVGELSMRMSIKAGDLIKVLISMGTMKTINEALDQDTAILAIEEIGHKAKPAAEETVEEQHEAEQLLVAEEGDQTRPPIITVMGHVDHGKTTLLDYIRNARVASTEAGGITQHIGAYHVSTPHGDLTFLDTPGHADFTAMRARGAKLTDMVVLVVAADDGVMPQTIETIKHVQKAKVPMVVAINKTDLESADLDRLRADLSAQEVVSEEWGGNTQFVSISAITGQGVKELLEAIALQAELLELKAAFDVPGRGHVIESRLDKGSGPMASLLPVNGTLKVGDTIVAGQSFGRIRAMMNEYSERVKSAGPAMPVEVLGLNNPPEVGDIFTVVSDEKKAKELVAFRQTRSEEKRLAGQRSVRRDDAFNRMGNPDKAVLNLILKTDVRGSLEAIAQAIHKLNRDEVQVNIVDQGVGSITESEALFAQTSQASLFGFNVRADNTAKKVIEKYNLNLRYYSVIYELIDDLKVVLSGMLAPELSEEIVGTAEVRNIFNSQRYGLIAGCIVSTGSMYRNKRIRVLRNLVVIYEGELESLRRVKEDVEEVRNGVECGIGILNYKDVQVGDMIETYDVREIARSI